MPSYNFRAITRDGRTVEGIHEADSKAEVLSLIREANNIPVEIEEINQSKDIGELAIFNRVKMKDIAIFCRQFYTMLNAGVTIVNCLDILRKQTESKALKKIIDEMYQDVVIGTTFSDAIKKHDKVFPELLISMVEAGEISGNLDGIMNRMAVHYENEDKINKKIKGSMIYPVILLVLCISVVTLMLTFVLPKFTEMFTDNGAELPLPTRIVMGMSDFLRGYWYVIVAIIGGLAYAFIRYYKSPSGRYNIDNLKLRIPIIGTSMRKIITSRFSRTLATLMASGVPLLDAIDIVGRVVSNRVIQTHLQEVEDELRRGSDLSGPIKKIKEFPPMLTHMIEIGEESGSIDDILDKTANFYDSEVEAAIQAMTALIEPVMIIIMAVIIGSIVVAMVLPMFEMVNTIN